MRNERYIDTTELKKAITQVHPDGELFEVRIIGQYKPICGYFNNIDELIDKLQTVDLAGKNIYFTLNQPEQMLIARADNVFRTIKATTKDNEITALNWLFVDLDPKRPAGISSTNEELKAAESLAIKIHKYLSELGFEEPVTAYSGNGVHLLYQIKLNNTEENVKLLERCLKALDKLFSNEQIDVDCKNFNPSRICKLYGTLSQKGSDTKDRPHRMAKIIGDVKQLKPTSKIFLQKLSEEIPEEPIRPAKYNKYSPSEFDIEEWMDRYNIHYSVKADSDSTKYTLDECPFDSSHKAPDSMIFKMPSGAIGFKCLHNSCRNRTWQDLRIMFEPDAYEKADADFDRRIEEGWKAHNRDKATNELNDVDYGNKWETIQDVISKPTPDNEYILTHITEIDKATHGLIKGGTSVWSGLRASAKSTVLSQIALNTIDNGHNVLFYSGELTDKRFVRWFIQQAAGKQYVKTREKNGSTFYYVPDEVRDKIASWIGERMFIYNNSYGNDYSDLIDSIEEKVKETKADLVIVDNLMMINLSELDSNEYKAQTKLFQKFTTVSKKYNCHIAIVAHPRKTTTFLRLIDIAGTGNIANLVDSAFIVHRNNHDFQKGTIEEFKWKMSDPIYNSTNVIEIAKDREAGIQDEFIPLWYEMESRRIKNEITETIHYKWADDYQAPEEPFIKVGENDDCPFMEV